MLDEHPVYLTTMAYEWCSVICQNYQSLTYREDLILRSLQIGFRHLDPRDDKIAAELTHTEHHQKLIETVFRYGCDEWIGNLLQAWTSRSDFHEPYTLLKTCARYLVDLQSPSARLRSLVIRAIELIGYQEFEQVGVGKFFKLLDKLRVGVEDMKNSSYSTRPDLDKVYRWTRILIAAINSSEGIRLSYSYWELLVEITPLVPCFREDFCSHCRPQITTSLEDAKDREKLECWIGVAWALWHLDSAEAEGLKRVALSLFRQRPSAIQKLEQRMGRRRYYRPSVSFLQICKQARIEGAQQNEL